MGNVSRRVWWRWVHIAAAIVLGTFVYSPWRESSSFLLLVQVFAFPVLAASGMTMWLAPKFNLWRTRRLSRGVASSS